MMKLKKKIIENWNEQDFYNKILKNLILLKKVGKKFYILIKRYM